jgi:hypothetical protein
LRFTAEIINTLWGEVMARRQGGEMPPPPPPPPLALFTHLRRDIERARESKRVEAVAAEAVAEHASMCELFLLVCSDPVK